MNNYWKAFFISLTLHFALWGVLFVGSGSARQQTGTVITISLLGPEAPPGGGVALESGAGVGAQNNKAKKGRTDDFVAPFPAPEALVQSLSPLLSDADEIPLPATEPLSKDVQTPLLPKNNSSAKSVVKAVASKENKPQKQSGKRHSTSAAKKPLSPKNQTRETKHDALASSALGVFANGSSSVSNPQETRTHSLYPGDTLNGNTGQGGKGDGADENAKNGNGSQNSYGYMKASFSYLHKHIRKKLIYPEQARRMGMTGTVLYSFTIRNDGKAVNVKVEKSSGYTLLDDAGVRAIYAASPFPPPLEPAHIVMPIDFKLR